MPVWTSWHLFEGSQVTCALVMQQEATAWAASLQPAPI